MYPQYTYMAGQQPQPQADPYLVGQPAVPQMAMPVLPPPAVHPVGTHPVVHGQHYVHVSTTPPQSVAVPYTQAGQTPIKLETSPTPPMPPPLQMTPKSDKMNSDSQKDEQDMSAQNIAKNLVRIVRIKRVTKNMAFWTMFLKNRRIST